MTAILLHAFGGSARSWDLVAPRLSVPTLAPDLRGFGGSPAPEGACDVASYVRDVLALVAPLEEFVLVGHSMGGKIALAVAATVPAGLRGLVLAAPSPPTPEPMTEEARRALLDGYGDPAVARRTVASVVRREIAPELREATIAGYLAASERAWRAWLEIGSREDLSPRMGNIAVPVRIVVGAEDPILGPDVQRREVAARLGRCSVEEVGGAGHLLPVEAPEELAAAIEAALDAGRSS